MANGHHYFLLRTNILDVAWYPLNKDWIQGPDPYYWSFLELCHTSLLGSLQNLFKERVVCFIIITSHHCICFTDIHTEKMILHEREFIFIEVYYTPPRHTNPACGYHSIVVQDPYWLVRTIQDVPLCRAHTFVNKYAVNVQRGSLADGLVSLFNGISTSVGYLMPKPFS